MLKTFPSITGNVIGNSSQVIGTIGAGLFLAGVIGTLVYLRKNLMLP